MDTLGNVMPSARYQRTRYKKLPTGITARAEGDAAFPRSTPAGRGPNGPRATDDPFTWLPWRPREDEKEGEEPERSTPQEACDRTSRAA